jgi:hypothetical protein
MVVKGEQGFVEKGQPGHICRWQNCMPCQSAKASKLGCENWSSSENNANNAWNVNFNNGNTNNNNKNNTNRVRAVRDSSTNHFLKSPLS